MTFATIPFRNVVSARTQAFGLPDIPVIFLPHPLMSRTSAEIDAIARAHLDAVIAAVLAPVTQ